MYRFRVGDLVKIRPFAELAHTTTQPPLLHAEHAGIIKAFTKDMYDPMDEMYDVLFDGETEIRYILFSDLCKCR